MNTYIHSQQPFSLVSQKNNASYPWLRLCDFYVRNSLPAASLSLLVRIHGVNRPPFHSISGIFPVLFCYQKFRNLNIFLDLFVNWLLPSNYFRIGLTNHSCGYWTHFLDLLPFLFGFEDYNSSLCKRIFSFLLFLWQEFFNYNQRIKGVNFAQIWF